MADSRGQSKHDDSRSKQSSDRSIDSIREALTFNCQLEAAIISGILTARPLTALGDRLPEQSARAHYHAHGGDTGTPLVNYGPLCPNTMLLPINDIKQR